METRGEFTSVREHMFNTILLIYTYYDQYYCANTSAVLDPKNMCTFLCNPFHHHQANVPFTEELRSWFIPISETMTF